MITREKARDVITLINFSNQAIFDYEKHMEEVSYKHFVKITIYKII